MIISETIALTPACATWWMKYYMRPEFNFIRYATGGNIESR